MSESMAKKCQQIWLKVMDTGEDISFTFPDKATMHRARFAFYDSVRKTKDEKLLEAKEGIEIAVNSKDKTLTLRRKDSNPFHSLFDNQLEDVIENRRELSLIALTESPEMVPEISVEESLKRFMNKLEDDSRPDTPYFRRDEPPIPLQDKYQGLCICCENPAIERCKTDEEKMRYKAIGLCSVCFDKTFEKGE